MGKGWEGGHRTAIGPGELSPHLPALTINVFCSGSFLWTDSKQIFPHISTSHGQKEQLVVGEQDGSPCCHVILCMEVINDIKKEGLSITGM